MTQKYRYPTFLESISTILVMVVVVVIGFVSLMSRYKYYY